MEELQSLLLKNGFQFKKQFGQNFISDETLLKNIVSAAEIDENSTVVEIGPGAGTLTREIAKRAKKVYAFEIDEKLRPVLKQTLADFSNVTIRFQDFMKVDLPAFEKEVGPYTVVANLPYYITTPLTMKFIEESEKATSLVIMVQEEVARRFAAEAGTADYGAITAGIALRGESKIVLSVPRTYFTPQPNVDSAVVKIDFQENRIPVKSKARYRETVRCAFLNRRKTLENNLVNYFHLSRKEAAEALSYLGVGEKARGETLTPNEFARLSDWLDEHLKGKSVQK